MNKSVKWEWLKLAIAVATLLVAIPPVVIGEAGLLPFLSRADVQFIKTPIIKQSNGYAQAFIITNRGREIAKDVVLSIDYYDALITDYQEDTHAFQVSPTIIEGGKGQNRIVWTFNRIPGNSRGSIYVTIQGREIEPDVILTYDNRSATEDVSTYRRPFSDMRP